jgi:hypothetical protein
MKATLLRFLTTYLPIVAGLFSTGCSTAPKGASDDAWKDFPRFQFDCNWFMELPRDTVGNPNGINCHLWSKIPKGSDPSLLITTLEKGLNEVKAVLNGDTSLWTHPEQAGSGLPDPAPSSESQTPLEAAQQSVPSNRVLSIYNALSPLERVELAILIEDGGYYSLRAPTGVKTGLASHRGDGKPRVAKLESRD